MTAQPLISIVVPAFNAASVLADALRSIQAQSYPAFQAIVVDDGSTDGTAAVALSFVEADRRFSLVHQPHRGASAARNAGVAVAKGDWITFLDADDEWLAGKLARQARELTISPHADFIFGNYSFWNGETDLGLRYTERKKFPMDTFTQRLIRHNLVGISTVMVRRDLLARAGSFDAGMDPAEDWDMWLRLAEAGWRPARIPEPLARYRIWAGNASNQTLRMAQATVRVLQKRLAECDADLWRRSYRRSLAIAQGNLEFAAVRPLLDTRPESLTAATGKAWRAAPWRLKWLAWSMAVRCPGFLGGNLLTQRVHRHIKAKW